MLIALAVTLAYAGALGAPFLFDDTEILDTGSLHELSWRTVTGTTRPLAQLTFAFNWAAGGPHVFGYHLVNVLVHVLAALTLYALVARTLAPDPHGRGLALAVALVWAVHPLDTESVTYVIQRAESLAGLAALVTLYAVIRGAAAERPAPWHVAAIVTCALGMLTKPIMVAASLVVLLYDRVFLAGSWSAVWRARRGLHLGLCATWAIVVLLLTAQDHESAATAGFAMRDVSFGEFVRSQPGVILHYLRLVVWPVGLVLDYGWPPATGFAGVALPAVALLGGTAVLLVALRGRPRAAFLVVAFVLLLAPSSSIVPIRDLAFEHRMYLPLAPIVALLVIGAWTLLRRARLAAATERGVALGALATVVGALMTLTIARNGDYRSPVAMWTDVTRKRPANVRAFSNLAQALVEEHRIDDAIAAARAALALDAGYAPAHVHLGRALAMRGAYADAEAHYAEAMRLDPSSAEAQNDWGAALADQKRYAEAEPHYVEALRLRPGYAEARNNLGVVLMEHGRLDEAAAAYREAIRLSPAYAEPWSNLGNLLLRSGKPADAVERYLRALALRPDAAEIHFNLALALSETGRRDEARTEAATALRLRPDLEPLVAQAGLLARP